jgi:drug/metabolite transporter (DMT)-like permease
MNPVSVGVLAALGAGLLWGTAFVAPLLFPSYPPAYLTFGRYLAFGLITLPIAWWQRQALAQLSRQNWWSAAKLSLVGNFIYYLALSTAIQLSSGPFPTLLIGTLPVVIAVCANWKNNDIQWRALAPSLFIIALGLGLVNADQLQRLSASGQSALFWRDMLGAAIAFIALAAWTWYPLKNSQWIAEHPSISSAAWTSAQGLVTLPMALAGLIFSALWLQHTGDARTAASVWGDAPLAFAGLMLFIGLSASWLGTYLWNITSQHTPPTLAGQLIVFETLAALSYTYAANQRWPSAQEATGIVCLIVGVVVGIRQLRSPAKLPATSPAIGLPP